LNLPTRVGLTGEGKPKFTKVIRPPPPTPEIEARMLQSLIPLEKVGKSQKVIFLAFKIGNFGIIILS
jgi:hypothetical protein